MELMIFMAISAIVMTTLISVMREGVRTLADPQDVLEATMLAQERSEFIMRDAALLTNGTTVWDDGAPASFENMNSDRYTPDNNSHLPAALRDYTQTVTVSDAYVGDGSSGDCPMSALCKTATISVEKNGTEVLSYSFPLIKTNTGVYNVLLQ
ncbi:MAG: hypothetical protein H7831_03350 [Magnetococcus sp. WYHC-3]